MNVTFDSKNSSDTRFLLLDTQVTIKAHGPLVFICCLIK